MRSAGFTLLEMLLVVAMMAMLATLVGPSLVGRDGAVRRAQALADMQALAEALELYRLDAGRYPTARQGLRVLTDRPEIPPIPRHWNATGYIGAIPVDPWGSAYAYAPTTPHAFVLRSLGADAASGGTAAGADIEVVRP